MFQKFTNYVDTQIASAARQAGSVFQTRFGLWFLGMISFVESVLPVPLVTDPFLAAYILLNRSRAVAAVIMTTLTSTLGGVLAYAAAVALFGAIEGHFLTGHYLEQFYTIAERFNEGVVWLTLLGALTPIPYTLVALAAGFVGANFFLFLVTTLLARGARYAVVGYLTQRYGEIALRKVENNITLITLGVVGLFVVYLLVTKF